MVTCLLCVWFCASKAFFSRTVGLVVPAPVPVLVPVALVAPLSLYSLSSQSCCEFETDVRSGRRARLAYGRPVARREGVPHVCPFLCFIVLLWICWLSYLFYDRCAIAEVGWRREVDTQHKKVVYFSSSYFLRIKVRPTLTQLSDCAPSSLASHLDRCSVIC